MIRAALAGYGWWGRHIAARLRGGGPVALTGVCAPELAGRQTIDGLPVYPDLAAALADPAAQAVILTTPNPLHEEQVLAAAAAGKHVFCEKPLALTGAAARRMVAACRAAGVVLGVGHERRFEPAMQVLAAMLAEGRLGTAMHAEAAFSHDRLAGLAPGNWRTLKAVSPAAGMTGMGIHLTDFLIRLFGPVEVVQALTADRTLGWETGDVVSVQLGFRAGMTASLSAILNTPHFIRFHIFGSDRWAEVRNDTHPDTPGGAAHLTVSQTGLAPEITSHPWRDTVRDNLAAFAAAVQGDAAYPFSELELVHNIEVLEAIARAAETRETVRLAPPSE